MIDKVVILNDFEALILYTHREPVRLTASDNIRNLVGWFLNPKVTIPLSDYTTALTSFGEDTCIVSERVAA